MSFVLHHLSSLYKLLWFPLRFSFLQNPTVKLKPHSLSFSLSLSLPSFSLYTSMADRQNNRQPPGQGGPPGGGSFLRRLQEHAPDSTQLMGILTLIVSGAILLLLTGATVTATVLGLVLFTPLIVLSSPIWVPAAFVLFFVAAGFLSLCGFGAAVVGGLAWTYRYFRGLHPAGSDRFNYARSRIYDTASHVKDYAREYGGYLQSKVKDAAPGA